jgi:hypothetical protein
MREAKVWGNSIVYVSQSGGYSRDTKHDVPI